MKRPVLTALFSLTAFAALAARLEPVKIAWTPKAGTEYKFKYKSVTNLQMGELNITANLSHKIHEVKPDGTVVVVDKQSEFQVLLGGQDVKAMAPGQVPDSITE